MLLQCLKKVDLNRRMLWILVLRYRSSQCTIQDVSDSVLNAISQMTHVLGRGHATVDLNDLTAVPYLNRY